MANSALRLSGGRTDMWRAWIGFNFSHGLGLLLVAALALWAGFRIKMLPVGIIMPALTLIAVWEKAVEDRRRAIPRTNLVGIVTP